MAEQSSVWFFFHIHCHCFPIRYLNFLLLVCKNPLYILDMNLCYVDCKRLLQSGYPINKKKAELRIGL